MALHKVFEPLKVGPVELPNRVVRTAHGGLEIATRMTDDYIAYHARRGQGGGGLTILGAASVHRSSQLFPLGLFHPDIVDDYRRLMAACAPTGMKVFAQLWHGGNLYNGYDGGPSWAVSDIPGMLGLTGQRMTEGMIHELIDAYTRCAIKAREGGLHGVEVHAAHGYCPNNSSRLFTMTGPINGADHLKTAAASCSKSCARSVRRWAQTLRSPSALPPATCPAASALPKTAKSCAL